MTSTNPHGLNPFIEEIEEDFHRTLLETGNLVNLQKGSHKWTGENCWLSEGFLAKIHRVKCRCGGHTDFLTGIFHIESNAAKKASRLVAFRDGEVLPTPGDTPHPVEVSLQDVSVCPSCLRGFTPMDAFPKDL